MEFFKILFLADVVGKIGRRVLKGQLSELKARLGSDICICNGENSAGGIGIDPSTAEEIFNAGVDVITTGNHVWGRKDLISYLERNQHRIIRPYNYAPGAPGAGFTKIDTPLGLKLGVVNLIARVFMPDLVDCPFQAIEQLLQGELSDCQILFLDFHGEATSEKVAMGYFLDGRIAAVVGTHTHVQTADERILPLGTAYITDVGMCGPRDSVIGVDYKLVVEKFRSGRPVKFEVASGPAIINGVLITINAKTYKAEEIRRVYEIYE